MRRLIKSRDYLKRCLGFLLIFGFMSLGAIVGCNSDSYSLVVVDAGLKAVVRVDPTTGDRTIISKLIIDPNDEDDMGMGSGPDFMDPSDIAVQDDGSLVVVDYGLDAVVRVDSTTGDRMIISDNEDDMGRGSGPAFMDPSGIAVQDDGSLVVVDSGLKAVVRVDPKTGDRMIISDNEDDMGMGSGPAFMDPRGGIAVQDDGSLVVVDSVLRAVVRVDPKTGDRMIISKLISDPNDVDDMGRGSGPDFMDPSDIAVQDDGSLVVVDSVLRAVVRVDPKTGDRMIISDNEDDMGMGSGPAFVAPSGIAVQDDGSLVVVDSVLKVVRVDPKTGDRMIISDNEDDMGMGSGPAFMDPRGIAVETW